MNSSEVISPQPTEEHLKVLKNSFKISAFKTEQWKIIQAIIHEKRDCFLRAATAYGKSLCFQFPPIFLKKTSIVFTPLESSAQDQVIKLKSLNIKACIFQPEDSSNLKKYQIIFILPESIPKMESLKAIKDQICLLAIDEWFLYQNFLPQLKAECPEIPLLYLTAVASKDDVCEQLSMENPLQIETSLDRPNLEYISSVNQREVEEILEEIVLDFKANADKGAMIIYATDFQAHIIARIIGNFRVVVGVYLEDYSMNSRQKALKRFLKDEIQVIVTTSDFRVDRSDVRVVVHFDSPENVEKFIVEQGQAGRDNKPAKCYFYPGESSLNDFDDFFMKYLGNFGCRRKFLLKCLNCSIEMPLTKENCCDNCLKSIQNRVPLNKMYKNIDKSNKVNFSADARIILGIVAAFNRTEVVAKLLQFLMGSVFPIDYKRTPLEFFGRGKGKSIEWWKKVLDMLRRRRLLFFLQNRIGGIPIITKTGKKYLKRKTLKLRQDVNDLHPFLERTNREFFIKNDKVFWRYRDGHKRTKIAENLEESKKKSQADDLFKFGTLKKSNDLPGCSKWLQPADESDEDEKDEEDGKEEQKQLKNLLWAQKVLKKPLKVDLDNLLDYAENYERSDERIRKWIQDQNQCSKMKGPESK